MKTVRKNKYTIYTTDQAWIHQDDAVQLLAFDLTRSKMTVRGGITNMYL